MTEMSDGNVRKISKFPIEFLLQMWLAIKVVAMIQKERYME